MTDDIDAWNEYAPFYQAALGSYTEAVHYGLDIATEDELHLLGDVANKRVLDLGCGGGQNVVALARQGATAIGIDYSDEQLRFARKLAEQEEVKVELKQGDIADLAFLPADNIDIVLSSMVFQHFDDLPRVFRQVHRVLTGGGLFVFSTLHPLASLLSGEEGAPEYEFAYSYYEQGPIKEERSGGKPFTRYNHGFADIYASLVRSGFKVEQVLEPAPVAHAPRSFEWRDGYNKVPPALIIRARNEGS